MLKVAYGSVPKDGGTFTFYRNLRPSLGRLGIDIRCVSVGKREALLIEEAYIDEGCVLLAADSGNIKEQAKAFAQWCNEEGIDIVLAINSVAILSALPYLPKHIRVVARCANAFDEGYRFTMIGRERLMRIIALTPRLQKDLAEQYGADPGIITLIPNGIDPSPFKELKREQPQSQHIKLGFLGRLEHRQKGVMHLPLIVAELKKLNVPFTLRIAGKGKHEIGLRKELKPHLESGEVEMVGALTKNEVPGFLKSIDVYLFTSHFEGCPNALLEAMMAGCVPVSFLIEGITDFVLDHGRTGFIAPMAEHKIFAEHIASVAGNPAQLKKISKAAANEALDRFIPDIAAERYAQVFREAMEVPLPAFEPRPWSTFKVDPLLRKRWTSFIPKPVKHLAGKLLNR